MGNTAYILSSDELSIGRIEKNNCGEWCRRICVVDGGAPTLKRASFTVTSSCAIAISFSALGYAFFFSKYE
jgi:hypothetical protein